MNITLFRPHSNLAVFIVVSVALHTALLAFSLRDSLSVDAGTFRETLSVQIDSQHETRHQKSAKSARTIQSAITAPAPIAMASPHTENNLSVITEHGAHEQKSESADHVRARVLNDFARHFYYPPIARQRGWEGRVMLAFHVEQDGQLRDPRVVRTSGFGVLDDAALNSLRKVERVADAGGAPLDMQIPVVYRLTDVR